MMTYSCRWMRRARRSVIYTLISVALASSASAISASIDTATNIVTVTYTEPNALVGGRPLRDLVYTTIYPHLRDSTGQVISLPSLQVPASATTGGGMIQQSFQVVKPDAGYHFVIIKVTATREVGVESRASRPTFVLSGRVIP